MTAPHTFGDINSEENWSTPSVRRDPRLPQIRLIVDCFHFPVFSFLGRKSWARVTHRPLFQTPFPPLISLGSLLKLHPHDPKLLRHPSLTLNPVTMAPFEFYLDNFLLKNIPTDHPPDGRQRNYLPAVSATRKIIHLNFSLNNNNPITMIDIKTNNLLFTRNYGWYKD